MRDVKRLLLGTLLGTDGGPGGRPLCRVLLELTHSVGEEEDDAQSTATA